MASMAASTIWWVLAGAAVALELVSGTFYLLMLAVGMVAAALAAHLGASVMVQIVVAAAVGGAAVVGWRWKRKADKPAQANANPDVQMDIGETVHVQHWSADATANVKYRGAQWMVELAEGEAAPQPGAFRVKQLNGNRLVVVKV